MSKSNSGCIYKTYKSTGFDINKHIHLTFQYISEGIVPIKNYSALVDYKAVNKQIATALINCDPKNREMYIKIGKIMYVSLTKSEIEELVNQDC